MVTLASLKVKEAINDFKEGLIVFTFARSKNQWIEGTNGQSTTVFSTAFLLSVNQQRHLGTEAPFLPVLVNVTKYLARLTCPVL